MVGSVRVLWPWPNGLDSTELEWVSDPIDAAAALCDAPGEYVMVRYAD